MSYLTLGLDLGANSVGWALLDEQGGKLLGAGVRVFPEGVDRDTKGGEVSKNEARRIARGMRRQTTRRARRKRQLRQALVEAGLFPADPAEQAKLDACDPYDLRRRALDEKLKPPEIGRALIHLNQHRGFLSNRRADKARKKENSEMLAEISELEKEIQAAGHRTLGEHFASLVAKEGEIPAHRVRGRHTRRAMYEQEFDLIWTSQQRFHPKLLTETLRYGQTGRQQYPCPSLEREGQTLLAKFGVEGCIFRQRPLYWPASVVGHCELESRLPRCRRADRRAQRFRMFNEVNNLRLLDTSTGEERPLSSDERQQLVDLLSAKDKLKFDVIRKKMGFLETVQFNLERGGRKDLKGLATDALLSKKEFFGKAWQTMPEEDKNRIVAALISEEEPRIRRTCGKLGISAELTEKLLDVELEQGYMSYSHVAIAKLLPHVEAGLRLTSRDGSPSALSAAGYVLPWDRKVNPTPLLPDPPELTNPLVRAALHEVRKVVNAVLRELVYRQGHQLAGIHVELAREVKGTAEERARQSSENHEREARRDDAADRIREHGAKPTRDAIDRYLLWEEQERKCVYSGKSISLTQVLGGEVDVDHILPYSRSLDNSLMNRVVCFRQENAGKGDRTPHEWLAVKEPHKYERVLQQADRLPYPKAKRFRQPGVQLDDFIQRQLNDTRYITTQVAQYVRCLGAEVLCPRGDHTAELRRQWGLNEILRDDGLNLKTRDDHRHHAVDAIVIALMNHSRLQQLSRIKRLDTRTDAERLAEPWRNFRAEAETLVNGIHVSHRVRRKVAGSLHEETLYGPTSEVGRFVYRKPLESLTLAMIEDIRDDKIRQLVQARLDQFKDKLDGKKIPLDVWKEPLRFPGSGVPIRKVRLMKNDQTIQPFRDGSGCVKPGSLHHLCIFEEESTSGKPVRYATFVSMLEASRRVRNNQPLIQRHDPQHPRAKFLMSLSANEMLLLQHNGKEELYRYETAASTTAQMHFRHHTAAGKSSEKLGAVSKKPSTFQGRKVTVDPIGRIRWAND
ncbi:MAG: type II CRISPR RNA-guided endonuclease Cas9 [Phycisphaeraceae bacterium]|nr:type II CRISPR RNA-guided endonuclease Cas9 [Phycisphaeraceae bacterium]